MRLLADPFAYAIPYNPIFDIARIFVIFTGLAILGRVATMLFSGEHKSWIASQKAGVAVFCGIAIQLITQETEQLGEDLVWWRLPLLLFIGINTCIVLFAQQATRGKAVNRTTTQYLVARAAIEDALCDRDMLAGKPCLNGGHDHG